MTFSPSCRPEGSESLSSISTSVMALDGSLHPSDVSEHTERPARSGKGSVQTRTDLFPSRRGLKSRWE
eukprot:scaffold306800_cov36-Prasinocladus_malaysianus.AAC.1